MKRPFKKIVVLLVAFILAVGTVMFPDIAEAKVKVGTPQMNDWRKVYDSSEDPNAVSNGVRYTLTWKKVKGAGGYQVQKYERQLFDYGAPSKWYKSTVSQKECSTSVEFSVHLEFKARVRAYKIVNGRRIYGKWSKMVRRNTATWQ